jgi:hypothetical protein
VWGWDKLSSYLQQARERERERERERLLTESAGLTHPVMPISADRSKDNDIPH